MIIPFSDFATRSLRRRTGVYRSAQGCWKGCLRHESTQLVFLFYFYREMSLPPSTLKSLLLPGTAWSSTTQALFTIALWLGSTSRVILMVG